MLVGVCSVGSELVTGAVADGNAHWLTQRLAESGCTVPAVVIAGDDVDQLVDALRWLAGRSDVLVVGGGLGPTVDDVTRDAVARFAGCDLARRPELVEHLRRGYERLGRPIPPDALRQADLPAAADVHAPRGTAAGFSLDMTTSAGLVRLHVLPGVPWEYRELAERAVLPDIVRRSGGAARVTRTLHVAGLGESAVGAVLRPLSDRIAAEAGRAVPEHRIELGFLAKDDEVLVRVSVTGPDPRTARERAEPVVREAVERLGPALTSIDDATLADEVARLLGVSNLTLATAETCTGGQVATALFRAGGGTMRGAYIAPAAGALFRLMEEQEPASTVRCQNGDRPEQLVAALARAARRRTGSDVALATVGVLDEPDATPDHPVGTVVWATAGPGDAVTQERGFIPAADRALLQARGAAFALESLRRRLAAHQSSRTVEEVTP